MAAAHNLSGLLPVPRLRRGLPELFQVESLPGAVLKRCSNEVRDLVDRAGMIISKGGGNFDTLDEEGEEVKKKVSFLLLSKCHPYHKRFGVGINQPILSHFPY